MLHVDYTDSADFLKRLFGETLHKVELRACPNDRGAPGALSMMTRDPAEIVAFCRRKDEPGIGVYFGACTRRDGAASGNLSTVVECPALWVDIDCAAQGLSGDETLTALQFLPHPPSIIVNSGGGLHAWWLLEETVDVSEGSGARDAVVGALRQLAAILAGDSKCAELARIMRLPGTRNSKAKTLVLHDGEPALCAVLEDTGRVHDFATLADWLGEQRAVLHSRAPAAMQPVRENDPFVAYARAAGYEPAIDIDQALAAMRHEATGDESIHQTQLRVSASMIARGYDDDEIVARILAATEAAAPRDARWNWGREERGIRDMVRGGRAKGFKKREEPRATTPQTIGNTVLKLVPNTGPAPKNAPVIKDSKSQTVAVGRATIGVWQDRHGPVMHTGGETYAYEAGVWLVWDERLAQRLRAIIQEACASLDIEPRTSILNAAKAFFMDRPELHQTIAGFDKLPFMIAADAALDLRSFEIVAHDPAHYATRKVVATLNGSRDCDEVHQFFAAAFSDQSEAAQIIGTVQEWFGAAIMPLDMKNRDLLKGLFVHGPSRSGKTQLSELVRHLLGHEYCSGSRMSDLEDRFGRESLIGKRGWIADDAVGEGETLDAETYKVVVTGEATGAKRKGKTDWNGRFGIPVLLTMNNIPRVRDQSDATFNRSLILPMTRVRAKSEPEPVGFRSISQKIGETQLTGLLWWAIDGWRRLATRQNFAEPEIMRAAVAGFKNDNNRVGAWLTQCVTKNPFMRVARADLVASFQGWRMIEEDDEKGWKANTVTRRLRTLLVGHDEPTVNGERYIAGVALNEEGLTAWARWKNSRFGENIGTVSDKHEVNKVHSREIEPDKKRTVF